MYPGQIVVFFSPCHHTIADSPTNKPLQVLICNNYLWSPESGLPPTRTNVSPHPTIANMSLVPFRTVAASALAPRSTGPQLLSSRQCEGNHRHGSTLLHTWTGPQPVRTAARLGTGRNPFVSCLGTVAHACHPSTGEAEVKKL